MPETDMTKVLVAYASKHGATTEIAEAIADELRNNGIDGREDATRATGHA